MKTTIILHSSAQNIVLYNNKTMSVTMPESSKIIKASTC